MARRLLRVGTLVLVAVAAVGAIGMSAASADPVLGSCDVVPNPTPTSHAECTTDDLGQVTVGGLDLSYAVLDHTTAAAGSVSDGSTFFHADLTDASWAGFGLDGSNFQGAVLDGIDLFNGRERGANFTGAHITVANLASGIFAAEAGFGPAIFPGADLSGTDFTGSTFGSGAALNDFTGATLTGTTFDGTALVPSDVSVAATSASGASVTWPAPQSETGEQPGPCHDAAGPVSSGSVFPVGGTTVTCEVESTANGTFGTGTFTVTVTGIAPSFSSADTATFTVGTPSAFTVTAAGIPSPAVTLTSGTLPAGVVAAPGGGTLVLSGTPAPGSGSVYHLTFTASNGVSPAATQDFTLTVDEAPAITSAASTTFTTGQSGDFTVTADGYPAASFSETGALPAGVSLAPAGTLSGTPAVGTGGTYPVTITASNGTNPDATQSFTLTVDQAPGFTSADSTTFVTGQAGSFTVTVDGYPTSSITATGTLPDGVTFANGVLSGTPVTGSQGTYDLTFTASNGVLPNATQNFTLTVTAAPAITSPDSTSFTVGTAGTFTVAATGSPSPTITESGTLPQGVTFAGGVLSGTPVAGTGATYPITFTAANSAGTATQTFTLTVDEAPAIRSADGTTFSVGAAGTFTVTASGFPVPTVTEDGALPDGVTFVGGVLSGTPAAGTGRTYPLTLTASNGVAPEATQTFTLTINQSPAITSADTTTFTVGQAGSFPVTTSGFPAATTHESGTLPGGVTFAGGVLSGTPAAGTGGTYDLTLTASNGVSPDATQTFTLTVDEAPAITSADGTTFSVGSAGTFTVTASGFPAPTNTEDGDLPDGVTFVGGVLSGTPATGTGGTYDLTLTASNGVAPDAVQAFTLTIEEAPAITSGDTTTFVEGHTGTFAVTTTGFPATITETGSLPPGVSFTDNHDGTATLAGTPTATGRFPITITDTNSLGTATQQYTLVVVAPLVITAALPRGTVGVPYHAELTATGGISPYSWSVTAGSLPTGLSVAADGTVSGTPSVAGTYHFTIQVNDPATKAMTIVIAAAPPPSSPPAPPSPPPAPQSATSHHAGGNGPLAATGADVAATVKGALALLLLGGALVLASRRRRPHGKHFAR